MYSVYAHGLMIRDAGRVAAYERALEQAVTPASIVLDIGAGTGLLSIMACRFGASRVYAIEPADVIALAREAAAVSGFADRVTFIQDLSTNISLSERADVLVSDLHGVLPLFQSLVPDIADARERLVKSGGALIPARDTLWVAVAQHSAEYRDITAPWEGAGQFCELPNGRRIAVNCWFKTRLAPDQLLSDPRCCGALDYRTVCNPDFQAELSITATRTGSAHGHVLWFDSTLADGVSFTNAPGAPPLIYGQAFFPWTRPVDLNLGDTIRLKLEAVLRAREYVWRWRTRVIDGGRADHVKAEFDQSTFFGELLSLQPRAAASYVPTLSVEGEIERFILSAIDGQRSQLTIASLVSERYPDRFANLQQALTRVAEVSQRYSRPA